MINAERYYYSNTISDFINDDVDSFVGHLVSASVNDINPKSRNGK